MFETRVIDWTEARCATGDARLLRLFFSEDPAEVLEAKALCGECPLRIECLSGALERQEPAGVWGGELFERGTIIERKRPRGRPRKDEVARTEAEREAIRRRLEEVREAVPA